MRGGILPLNYCAFVHPVHTALHHLVHICERAKLSRAAQDLSTATRNWNGHPALTAI
jgi:hypothetical protein